MDISRKCAYISNGYYNKGLGLAREGNMTGAADALKRALQFNKHNTNARNLLGLIYYRIGEVSDALVQWVLSLNLHPEGNAADRYLDEVQRQQGLLDSYGQVILKFNQTLALAQSGSEDLAIIQLSKIADHNPDYLRASTLMGLMYLGAGQPQKALKYIQNALRIDKGNVLALRCLEELRSMQKEKHVKKRNGFPGISKNKGKENDSENDQAVVPGTYKSSTGWSTAGNILIGLLIGAASILYIYLPIKEASLAREYNEQVISISEKLNRVNSNVKDLEKSNTELTAENEELLASQKESDRRFQDIYSNLQSLAGAVDAYKSDRLTEAAGLYAQIDPQYMTDIQDGSKASVEKCYSDLKTYFEGEGYQHFMDAGNKALEAGNFDSAIENYKICILICPDRAEPVFREGLAYKKGGNPDHAAELFNEVIEKFPDSEYADKAREERGV